MDEGRKRVIVIMAAILASLHRRKREMAPAPSLTILDGVRMGHGRPVRPNFLSPAGWSHRDCGPSIYLGSRMATMVLDSTFVPRA